MANELSNLKPSPGSTKSRMRVGRGEGSGKGRSAGRGTKGQGKRGGVRRGFEGGQMPLHRRMPKRGFTNIFAKRFTEVRLDAIAKATKAGETVDVEMLRARGLVRSVDKDGIKVLGNGELAHKLVVKAHGFTKSAIAKIEAAGGSVEILGG